MVDEKNYEFIRQIGDGGYCEIYEVFDKKTKQKVAIKLLKSKFYKDKLAKNFIRHEARVLKELDHPNIIQIYDSVTDFAPFLVLEYFPHPDLSVHVEKHNHIDIPRACEISLKIAKADDYLNKKGLLHVDIKPGNILYSYEDNEIKICDFALAHYLFQKEKNMESENGLFYGSPGYLAPEIVDFGAHHLNSDIFSQGALLYALLTKTKPFEGFDALETIMLSIHNSPLRLENSFPKKIRKLIEVMTEKKPKNRPNQSEVISLLESIVCN